MIIVSSGILLLARRLLQLVLLLHHLCIDLLYVQVDREWLFDAHGLFFGFGDSSSVPSGLATSVRIGLGS